MNYDDFGYHCIKCGWIKPYKYDRMLCPICEGAIRPAHNMHCAKDQLYYGNYNFGGKQVFVNGKTEWRRHLKANGLTDDVGNPASIMNLKPVESYAVKKRRRELIEKSVRKATKKNYENKKIEVKGGV